MKDFLNGYKQQPPFSIQVEPTEGCNLGCEFCGLRGVKENGKTPWNFMSVETAKKIASEIKRVEWKSKIIFAMHGEPTLNKKFFEIVSIFRELLPNNSFHMYSNGFGFNHAQDADKYVDELFSVGMDNIMIDCYSDNGDWNFVNKLNRKNRSKIVMYETGIKMFPDKHDKRILLLPPIQMSGNKTTMRLVNHSGCAAPLDMSYNNKRCTMPFREMSFRWTGDVAICCDDFRGKYPIANIWAMKIDEIWNHPNFQAARIMLYDYRRDFGVCNGCTNISMRVGFLPDSSGQDSMPKPSEEVLKYANDVLKNNKGLSDIVLRDWEL